MRSILCAQVAGTVPPSVESGFRVSAPAPSSAADCLQGPWVSVLCSRIVPADCCRSRCQKFMPRWSSPVHYLTELRWRSVPNCAGVDLHPMEAPAVLVKSSFPYGWIWHFSPRNFIWQRITQMTWGWWGSSRQGRVGVRIILAFHSYMLWNCRWQFSLCSYFDRHVALIECVRQFGIRANGQLA